MQTMQAPQNDALCVIDEIYNLTKRYVWICNIITKTPENVDSCKQLNIFSICQS